MKERKRLRFSSLAIFVGIIIVVGVVTLSSCIVIIGDDIVLNILGPEIKKWEVADFDLPTELYLMASAYHDGNLYIVGGDDGGGETNGVYYAELTSSGDISSPWVGAGETLPVPARSRLTAAPLSDKLYVFGGDDGLSPIDTVNWADFNANGTIGSFNQNPEKDLITGTRGHATVVYNGYIYVIGGERDGDDEDRIEFASKSLDWASTTSLAGKEGQGMAAVAYEGRLYVFGGDFSPTKTKYTEINSDGSLDGSWRNGPDCPSRTFASAVVYRDYVYLIGGLSGIDPKNTVYYAKIKDSGSLVPEFGGMLDILDSPLLAAPVAQLLLMLMTWT